MASEGSERERKEQLHSTQITGLIVPGLGFTIAGLTLNEMESGDVNIFSEQVCHNLFAACVSQVIDSVPPVLAGFERGGSICDKIMACERINSVYLYTFD